MREKMMNKDYAKAFKTIVIMAVLLALLSAVVIPLSLSQQISDLSSLRQTSQEQTAQQDGEHSEHHADREELWKSQITPPTAGTLAALGGIAGLFGLTVGAILLLVHLAGLTSLGVAYLAPFSDVRGWRAVLRPRLSRQKFRDPALGAVDRKNQR